MSISQETSGSSALQSALRHINHNFLFTISRIMPTLKVSTKSYVLKPLEESNILCDK